MEDKTGESSGQGVNHFKKYLERIEKPGQTRGNLWWYSIEHFGDELGQSLDTKEITPEEAEGFRKKIDSFMKKGDNLSEYKKKVGDIATFWWKENE